MYKFVTGIVFILCLSVLPVNAGDRQSPCANGNPTDLCEGEGGGRDGNIKSIGVGVGIGVGIAESSSESTSTSSASVINSVPVTVNVEQPGGGFTPTTIEGDDIGVVVEGDTFDAPDADDYPGTPATIFTDACGSGAAAGFPGGSASVGEGNEVCLWLAVSRAASEQGETGLANLALQKAAFELEDQNDTIWKRWSQTPYVGWLAPRRWLPFFGKNF